MTKPRPPVLALVSLIALAVASLALSGCGNSGGGNLLPTPGPGVIFSYPHDGQRDIPVGASTTGKSIGAPIRVVRVSMLLTSTR